MATVKLNISAIGGMIQTQFSGNVAQASDGTVVVDVRDVPDLLRIGAVYINNRTGSQTFGLAPRQASAARIVSSASLANGTLTVANQPDVPRRLTITVWPGTAPISGGTIAFPYTANDGAAQTDSFALAMAASVASTFSTSKGVLVAGSAVVTGLAGGASPGVQIDDTNFLAMMVEPGFQNFAELKENYESGNVTVGTLAASAGCISPNIQPNGSHTYGFSYSYTAPDA
jgi:hypothetical protein